METTSITTLRPDFYQHIETDCVVDETASLLGRVGHVETKGPSTSKTSTFGAVFIVVNACIGAGLLNFPSAYQSAGGIVVGVAMQLFFLVFIVGSLLVLAVCADVQHSNSYQDIMQSMCGGAGNIACAICVIVYCFGTCVTFFIIMGDQLDSILDLLTQNDGVYRWYTNRKFTITVFACLIILPLCLPKNISILKWPSSLGVIGTLYVATVVIVNYYLLPANPQITVVTRPAVWTDVFAAIPTICFGFQCHISSVPVYASLKKRTIGQFAAVITGALVIATLTYILTGVFGSLTFGDAVCSDVLLSYDSSNITVTVARVMILCNMLTSYPILHFCGRLALETVYLTGRRFFSFSTEELPHPTRRRVIETLSWFCLSLLLALFVPTIGAVISVIGGLAAVFIFVFPGLCLIQYIFRRGLTPQQHSPVKKYSQLTLGIVFVAMGTFMFGESVVAALMVDFGDGPSNQKGC